jgi:hypothetical protein
MNHNHTVINGALGMIATAGSVVTSFQTQLEWWFRMTSLTVGIAVGVLTLYKLIKKP